MTDEIRVGVAEIAGHFEELDDPRSTVNRRYPLPSVMTIAIMAILAGASGPTGIARWAEAKESLLADLLDLPFGVPRKDVFQRLFAVLNPAGFQACFAKWLESLQHKAAKANNVDRPHFAIDGKTLRRSHDKKNGLGPLHSVSVWASEMGLTLAQVATDEKSNEITAIPEVLRLVDLNGAIITIDAMGAQKKIAKQIVDGGGDYVLGLKGNQSTTHQSVIDHVDEHIETGFANVSSRTHMTKEKGHGREETRIYTQMPAPKHLPGLSSWPGLATIVVVMSICIRAGKETRHTRYYLSSLPMGVKRVAEVIRGHWTIENSCHWSLDVTYREDDSRIRGESVRENFAWLNRVALSLIKQHPAKDSQVMKRRRCGWDDDFLLEVLTGTGT